MSVQKALKLGPLAFLCLTCGSGAPPTNSSAGAGAPHLAVVVSGFQNPLHLTAPPGDSARLFVVEQRGTIRIIKNGQRLNAPFLDITGKVTRGNEQGLLSVAFHPRYATNGYFYVNYTDVNGDTRVERYTVSGNADVADPGSGKMIIMIEQPASTHNGGLVTFGPDGMLYIGMGDGGCCGDPRGHGQNRADLLGDLLRIDVDHGDPYAVPSNNPFVGQPGMRGEIWAWGLRNPWRFAFDRKDSRLYIADVGQNEWEEVDVAPTSAGGLNYGWNIMEGKHCYESSGCNQQGLTLPVIEYSHSNGCSITGGFVYRGARVPSVQGHYFYADYCQGWVRSFKYVDGAAREQKTWDFGDLGQVLSFGEDATGELYILSANGNVYRLTQ